MSSLTVEEVKSILRLDNSWSEGESVTFSSLDWKRLTYKPVSAIYRVDTDTEYSTASAYDTTDYETTTDYRNYTLINRIDTGTIADTETVYVSYSYNEYEEIIEDLLPQVEYDVCDFLNNYFEDTATEYASSSIKLIARSGTSHPQITDTENDPFTQYGFADSMDIVLKGTPRNWGIYRISDASTDILKLTANDTLLAESSTVDYGGHIIQINRINWPPGIKRLIAYIIWHNIQRARNQDVKSKTLGPSSITYAELKSGGYPDTVYDGLNKYKKMRMK